MLEEHAEIGGEGSSGGLIESSFNLCRDSMLAAITMVKAIKKNGPKVLDEAPSYHQVRLKLAMERKKALSAMKRLQKENPDADSLDGIKIRVSRRLVGADQAVGHGGHCEGLGRVRFCEGGPAACRVVPGEAQEVLLE